MWTIHYEKFFNEGEVKHSIQQMKPLLSQFHVSLLEAIFMVHAYESGGEGVE